MFIDCLSNSMQFPDNSKQVAGRSERVRGMSIYLLPTVYGSLGWAKSHELEGKNQKGRLVGSQATKQ